MRDNCVVLMGKDSASTNAIFHALRSRFNDIKVIVEDRENTTLFLRRRIKKLGWSTTVGQIFFQVLVVSFLNIFSIRRKREIKNLYGIDDSLIPGDMVSRVKSVNDSRCIALLKEASPCFVVVSGTRIISSEVLDAARCLFVNIHAGITPQYRGVHGMYWALINRDLERCGVTVHLIDSGIDTGEILSQSMIHPARNDNFVTYPLLQLGEGIKLLMKALDRGLEKRESLVNKAKGRLWYHPTLYGYLCNLISKGVK